MGLTTRIMQTLQDNKKSMRLEQVASKHDDSLKSQNSKEFLHWFKNINRMLVENNRLCLKLNHSCNKMFVVFSISGIS